MTFTTETAATYEQKRLKYREDWPVLKHETYLNHAAHAPWSNSTIKALQKMMDSMNQVPMSPYSDWYDEMNLTRDMMAEFIGASVEEVGFNFNTSLSIAMFTHFVPWKMGDNIIVPDRTFPAIVNSAKLMTQWGVEARKVACVDDLISEDSLIEICDDRTRMMIIPLINFLTGQRLEVAKLSEFCRSKGIFLVVDAIQAAGPMQIDVKKLGCHALCFGSPKWMFGPMGIGTFYVDRDIIKQFHVPQMGMFSIEDPWNFFDYDQDLVDQARVYECGCPNILPHYGLNPTLKMFLDLGTENTESYLLKITGDFYDKLTSHGIKVLTPREDHRRGAIVSFDAKSAGWEDADVLHEMLDEKLIRVAVRMGLIRVSPHFYNTPDELDMCFDAIVGQ